MIPTLLHLFSIAVSISVLGCSPFDSNHPHAKNPHYGWGFQNSTGKKLNDVAISFRAGKFDLRETAGVLVVGASKNTWPSPDPITDRATVTWKTPDGVVHETVVTVAERVADPKGFNGTIWFRFDRDGGVTVLPVTKKESYERAVAHQPAIPEKSQ